MSDPENRINRPALIVTIIAALLLMTGCVGIKRAWNGLFPSARAQSELPAHERSRWVPLGSLILCFFVFWTMTEYGAGS